MTFLRHVWAIVAKDVTAELHTREIVNAMLVFALLATLIFSFALDLQGAAARAATPGVFWVTVAFAGTLGLSRSMAREVRDRGMEGVLLAPVDRSAIFIGKAVGNLFLMAVVEAILMPLFVLLFDVSLLRPAVVGIVLLGTVGYAAAGTLLAAVAVNTRAREVLLPVLLLPLTVPLLLAVVRSTGTLVTGGGWGDVVGWVRLIVAYDVILVSVSTLLFEAVVEG